MGYNTSVVILNDALHELKIEPDLGRKIVDAIHAQWAEGKPMAVPGVGNAIQIIKQTHMDDHVSILVGDNTGKVITSPKNVIFSFNEICALKAIGNKRFLDKARTQGLADHLEAILSSYYHPRMP